MSWFSGPIQDAIASAKHNKKIFLVFVEGKDETSKNMATVISQPDISQRLGESCVAIKLSTDSESFRQFSQIYPVIVVPSMFFIGDNGIPLEVIAGSENAEDLSTKVQRAIQLHKVKASVEPVQANKTASIILPTTGGATTSKEVQLEPKETEAASHEAEDLLFPNSIAFDNDSLGEEEAKLLLQQKLERAEQLLTQRRILKEKERIEEEKRRELEHRRVGRELQRAREEMKDKEMNDWAKQRQREKQEDKAARERILAQIAQDKADRAAKFQYSPAPAPSSSSPQASSTQPEVRQRSPANSASSNGNIARIQFRLPNSTARTYQFSSDSTLSNIIDYLNTEVKPMFPSGFSLATTFPRRHFARCDYPRTLQELELTPTAVLLVLPLSAGSAVSTSGSGGLWSLLWTFLSPLTLVWGYISAVIFGRPTPRTSTAPTAGASDSQPSTSQNNENRGPVNPNVNRYRRDGNVHRLANESSNEDEDGTWNGNSTQQM